MSSPKLDRNIYAKSIVVLKDQGWCQGELIDTIQDNSHCILGAMAVAYGIADSANERSWDSNQIYEELLDKPEVHHLADNIGSNFGNSIDTIIDWNDDGERKESDVIDKLTELANEVS